MTGIDVILGRLRGRRLAALMRDGVLDDLLVEPPEGLPVPGAIYRARVDRPIKGLGGSFVSLPGGTGFLRQGPGGGKGLRPGAAVLVQVTGHAEGGKAVPVTTRILFKSRYAIVTPGAPGRNVSRAIRDEEQRLGLQEIAAEADLPEDAGLIIRSAAAEVMTGEGGPQAVLKDISAMAGLAAQVLGDAEGAPELLLDGPDPAELAWRDWPAPDGGATLEGEDALETAGLVEAIDALRDPGLPLSGGGRLWLEPTRAFVAVDIDTGGEGGVAAGLRANMEAMRALPRALRLRGLGGQIVIDAAPTAHKDRRLIEQALRTALRADPVETTLVGWTTLGHMELQRKRERLPLSACLPMA